jgi:hypothetical protein
MAPVSRQQLVPPGLACATDTAARSSVFTALLRWGVWHLRAGAQHGTRVKPLSIATRVTLTFQPLARRRCAAV